MIPAVPYLQALDLDKEDLVQALGLSFTISTIALAIGLTRGNAFNANYWTASVLALGPALVGMWVGQIARKRISPAAFRWWFLVCLFLLGVELMARPLL